MTAKPAGDSGRPRRGFAIAGSVPHDIVRAVARAAEQAGYDTFWVNEPPEGDGLAALREAAAVTASIRLGVGVIPLDRISADRIAARVDELGLPVERLALGIGSGRQVGGVARVREGVRTLRELSRAQVIVGALGPQMCRLGGEIADGVLLNWLVPGHVRASIEVVERAARAAARPRPAVDGYIRTALGAAAIAKLRQEGDRYASYPAYADHFARMAVEPMATAVVGDGASEIRRGLAAFDAVLDETVVRAIVAEETTVAYLELLAAAAPA